MAGINKAIIVGNVGSDPEIKYLPNGDAVANFSIATSESWKDKKTGEKVEKTEWHRCVAFRRLGEVIGEYVRKGSKLYVEGKIQTRKWQGDDGKDRYTTEIVLRDMQMLDSRSERNQQGADMANVPNPACTPSGEAEGRPTSGQMGNDVFDDDIPF